MDDKTLRNRTIRWSKEANEAAEEIAFKLKLKRGVSELLERLVAAETKRKRGIAHLHAPLASSK